MIKLFTISILLFTTSIYAGPPKKYSNCNVISKINAPNGHNGFYISSNCKDVYVLPPIEGRIEISNVQTTLDHSLCSSTMKMMDAVKEEMNNIKEARNFINDKQESVAENDIETASLNRQCKDKGVNVINYDKQIKSVRAEINYEKSLLADAIEFRNNCVSQNGDNSFRCSIYESKIRNHKKTLERGQEILKLGLLKVKLLEIDRDSCFDKLKYLVNTKLEGSNDYNKIKDNLFKKLSNYQDMLNTMLASESSVNGAEFGINILSRHQLLVQDFIQQNNHLDINFIKMPLKKAEINFNMIENGADIGYPVIAKADITGFELEKSSQGILNTSITSGREENVKALFGEGVGGNIVINRLATCKLLQQTQKDLNPLNVAELIRPTVNYEYELQVDRRINVALNESHFYQLVRQSTKSKSGLFKTKTLNSLTETSNASKWIDIEFYSEDADHAFINSLDMSMDIKREFAQAAISKVAKSYLTDGQVNLLEGGETGAKEASSVLKKDCKQKYCQKAAIILDLGNALFGGSSQEADMSKIVKAMQRTNIKDSKMVPESGQQVFRP